ncbi:Planctomycete cytochrome C [Prosthecobacter debontii]|uniref:Planctomycete cytochrome C n=1 Tax=Prosthecobacter debontii TaxID=48467 RepID=A0A1T4WI21_9BACT|nr:DUF1553 domain-containing protein [Prosthecobacter debontii]SKA76809.1 Planctomycete cytochrome C [Prosthecobacter debontii]
MICKNAIPLLLLSLTALPGVAAELEFNRDIRPILSDKCFHCHGFDPKTRKAGLRLDEREAAVTEGHIVPGDAAKSVIIERVLTHDADEVMPPPESKLGRLTEREIATLQRWVNEGAKYQKHWSFIAPDQTQMPRWKAEAQAAGEVTPIDHLVKTGLKARQRQLQPPADAETLIRRASFDLTGLPPSATEVQAFTAKAQHDAQGAYADLISRLLASPAYGERMAVDWLDVARYADSYGFQVDRPREVWMWRDWVIRAFNDNLPLDQFITWQVAGDLLQNATEDQVLATAFNRLHQQESEGGSVEEEYRIEYVADRVQTFATAFLGLTFECARCHDHKYDPISQKEYYGLSAFLQNIDEAGLYSFFTQSAPTPAMKILDKPNKKKKSELEAKIAKLERDVGTPDRTELDTILQLRAGSPQSRDRVSASLEGQIAHFTFNNLDGNKLEDSLNPSPPQSRENVEDNKRVVAQTTPSAKAPKKDPKAKAPETAATLKGENKLAPGRLGQAILFTGDDPVDTPVGNFHRYDPFSLSLWIKTPDVKERAVVLHRSRAWTDAASRGYELLIEEGKLKWSLIHFWPGDAISIRAQQTLPLNEWVHVVVTNDGSSRANGLKIFINGQQAQVETIRDHLTKDITGGGGDTISLGERFRDRGFKGGAVDDLWVFSRDVSQPLDAGLKSKLADLKEARRELTELMDGAPEIMVMQELPQPKKAYVLFRGEYDKRGEEAPPVTPASLSPYPKDAPKNRLGLARWLTSPEHPLVARVIVNRLWHSLFGRGLVKTSEDFGSQGEKPLYPELLDYLALRLIESGWDVKALLREIVSSEVYRQRSIADPALMADDPENQWLARGPRFRLPAEMIRDNALAASGLLGRQVGGPPVNPYEMTEAFKPVEVSKDTSVYRRSVYTTWRRTSPPPAMVAFDAPRRAVCSAKRERTDSPLQALILLNGTQYVEAARALGESLHREAQGKLETMIEQGFLRCLSRRPDAREREICTQLYQDQRKHYQAHPQEAEALLQHGNSKPTPDLPLAESAAATILAQALMNHDACVVKR